MLGERRYLTLLLRLVTDQHGRLLQGEFVELDGSTQARFVKARGLSRALRAYLARLTVPAEDQRTAPP